jgi:hypothetical protein
MENNLKKAKSEDKKKKRLSKKAQLSLKGVSKKKFVFSYISAPSAPISKILVSTLHNTPLIMGDRHKNFEGSSTGGRDIRKTKFDPLGFFLNTLYYMEKMEDPLKKKKKRKTTSKKMEEDLKKIGDKLKKWKTN